MTEPTPVNAGVARHAASPSVSAVRVLFIAGLCSTSLLSACDDGRSYDPGTSQGSGGAGQTPSPPVMTLPSGSRYFERDGRRAPVLLRNVSAPTAAAFAPLFEEARAAGTTVVRLQLTQGFGYETLGIDARGKPLPDFMAAWDAVLDEAARRDLPVIPVFAIWGDWNDGTPDLGWSHFSANPLNSVRGGPATSPAELFDDTETQAAWLAWLGELAARWSWRSNIVAWEAFSELDLASGVTEASATAFVARANEVIREADDFDRPVFASTSDLPMINGAPWQALWASSKNDLVSLHPYDADLDRVAVERTLQLLQLTEKPVLLGESGLDAAPPDGTTLTSSPNAAIGLRNAIWAELVSGAASARALYWEDGYAAYYPATGLPLVSERNDLEMQAAAWLADKSFDEIAPVSVVGEPAVFGVALGSAERVLGWARNAQLIAPGWDAMSLDRVTLRVSLPSDTPDASWSVVLTNPTDGAETEVVGSSSAGEMSFEVEGPVDSVAFEATR